MDGALQGPRRLRGAGSGTGRRGLRRRPRRLSTIASALSFRDLADRAMRLVFDSGGELDVVRVAAVCASDAIANPQRPQAIDRDRAPGHDVTQRSSEIAVSEGVSIDQAVAEVPHQQVAGECSEAGRGDSETPGRVELSVGDEPIEQVAVEIEAIDKPVSTAGHIVVPGCILLGERDVERTTKVLDIKGCIAFRDLGIRKRTGRAEVGIEYVDLAGPEVGRGQVVGETVEPDGKTLEHRARLHVQVVDLGYRDGSVRRLPTGDRAVFGR